MKHATRNIIALALILMFSGSVGCQDTKQVTDVADSNETGDRITEESDEDSDVGEESAEVSEDLATNLEAESEESNSSSADETITSSEITIPDLNLVQKEIPDTDALQFAEKLQVGWNLGNTFDAFTEGESTLDELEYESMWCGVETTKEMIDAVKEAGFQTIRIPVSWHNHMTDDDYTISDVWMDRVHEVVDYAIDDDMYVILNIHSDCYEGYYYPTNEQYDTSAHFLERMWTQIADEFADYDDHLIFEGINEPRLTGTDYEWWLDSSKEICTEAVDCVNQLNQVFVDTVRADGENNATRYLMVPGYDASADSVISDDFVLPQDSSTNDNKIIVSVHAYTPYNFALQLPSDSSSVSTFDVNSTSSTQEIDYFMGALYDKYVSQGIPVVIGEFGAIDKDGNTQERVNYASYYIACAKANGIPCLWWDNNAFTGDGECLGIFRRRMCSFLYTDILDAIMKYSQ